MYAFLQFVVVVVQLVVVYQFPFVCFHTQFCFRLVVGSFDRLTRLCSPHMSMP
jgi:hypothetical protein